MIIHVKHRFNVPVEFRYKDFAPVYDGNGHVSICPRTKIVSKLKCELCKRTLVLTEE